MRRPSAPTPPKIQFRRSSEDQEMRQSPRTELVSIFEILARLPREDARWTEAQPDGFGEARLVFAHRYDAGPLGFLTVGTVQTTYNFSTPFLRLPKAIPASVSFVLQPRSHTAPQVMKVLGLRWHHVVGCCKGRPCPNGKLKKQKEIAVQSRA